MNDQSTPIEDPAYQDSMHDTLVTQRLRDWAHEHLGKADFETFDRLLAYAYEGIRPDGPNANVYDLDIN